MDNPTPRFKAGAGKSVMLVITAMGVVFGDIGTSPLYALRECFHSEHGFAPTQENVFGILSLFFWSLNLVVSLKYVLFIMHAHNRGEGGILALEALARRRLQQLEMRKLLPLITLTGIFGSALLFGDGVITPAISVLSALEGLKVATPLFEPYVVPLTVVVLVVLFSVQRFGTARIGAVFGPITLTWFLAIGVMGFVEVFSAPEVLSAMDPRFALRFFAENGYSSLLILGTVFLCVTGGEAMYADMGHFGRRPIKRGWFFIAFPALLLNYFGQGALILKTPAAIENPFFLMAPQWALYPLVGLACVATVIASQALISGVFSLVRQAVQMNYSPRVSIVHTNLAEIGQIYVPTVNWLLLVGSLWLVLTFQSSSRIAHAYGVAVSLTMLITTCLAIIIARYVWRWRIWTVALICLPLLVIDLSFFAANAAKILRGGWIPLAIATAIMVLATTWIRGRKLLAAELGARSIDLQTYLKKLAENPPLCVDGTAVFMTGSKWGTPLPFINNIVHNKVIHKQVVLLTFVTSEVPHVSPDEQVSVESTTLPTKADESRSSGQVLVESAGSGGPNSADSVRVYRLIVQLGFMDRADVQQILHRARRMGLEVNLENATFFLGREIVLASSRREMATWRHRLFSFMGRNAQSPALYFNIPPARVIEVGMQVEI